MKKVLVAVGLLASVSMFNLYAQKSKKQGAKDKSIELTSKADSISYAYGAVLSGQGLSQYLKQMNVIIDVIGETDQAKIDSINTANAQNLQQFLLGANDRLFENQKSPAYNKGFEIAGQIEMMGQSFEKQVMNDNTKGLNLRLLLAGIADDLANQKPKMEDAQSYIDLIMKESQERASKEAEIANASVIEAGKAFMEENAKRPNVVTLPSGLQYEIEVEGTGAIPTSEDIVKVHYTGTLLDGTVFDSSVKRGSPISLGVKQVIPGWAEVLQLMPVGSKWKVYVPYHLAYGDQETGLIKPYSNLIFDIELFNIE